ncbi:hypothetical protein F0M18_18930 [Pseudohalioglobus sediminis]|uniref:Uncharacterized protein n=1 Tax=Pseudohalioglobus sediminis TaxID=2606449 RepID=A0A5B0WMR0_9GAMM|nr:hypothetical protein [Pseudohalioglobus sediminis]KAA1188116.1 hypothetical protein F0M18_18930 [Pseudohalioglobus sediminis]
MSRASRKYYRTVLLGVAAMAALLWAAVDQFGISTEEIGRLLLATLAVVGLVIAAAAVCVGLWIGLRHLLRKK